IKLSVEDSYQPPARNQEPMKTREPNPAIKLTPAITPLLTKKNRSLPDGKKEKNQQTKTKYWH
ncbi:MULTISPECIES: hypothetical protein, partial [unclassified Rhodococcus (in: high G+C Gram-positive bacteria)]|uniref:hypothetical protein n=1 Tax=unclassified Rhodococcus (in: high G+C Gram-positive bacteria) TaxID=192944 RepID=UPI001C9BA298